MNYPAPAPNPAAASQPPRRRFVRRHPIITTFAGIAAAITLGGILGSASPHAPGSAPGAITPATAPATGQPAAPSPAPPTTVEFIISGYAPGDGYGTGPSIDWGSDSDTHQAAPASINGTVTFTMPFSQTAEYYDINAQLTGTGHLSCKIVVTGPGDAPLTVSSGTASGGYSICGAQATTSDDGMTWTNEQS